VNSEESEEEYRKKKSKKKHKRKSPSRTPSEDKHISRRPSGPDAIGKSGEMSESELEKQRALLLAQLKEPESE
jgi:hypothetical protein